MARCGGRDVRFPRHPAGVRDWSDPTEETIMNSGAQTAAALAAGYFLGRTRKMRLALMIAAAGATGKLGTGPRELVQQGVKRLSESAEFSKITESVRGELLDAAKSAATAAATNRIGALNERLQQGPGAAAGAASDAAGGLTKDEAGENQDEDEGEGDAGQEQEPARRPRRRSQQDAGDEEEPERQAGRRRAPARAGEGRSRTREGAPSARNRGTGARSTQDRGTQEDGSQRSGQRRAPARTQARSSDARSPVRRTRR
jgi:hypothetical protein